MNIKYLRKLAEGGYGAKPLTGFSQKQMFWAERLRLDTLHELSKDELKLLNLNEKKMLKSQTWIDIHKKKTKIQDYMLTDLGLFD